MALAALIVGIVALVLGALAFLVAAMAVGSVPTERTETREAVNPIAPARFQTFIPHD